jgi:hypothetical protein
MKSERAAKHIKDYSSYVYNCSDKQIDKSEAVEAVEIAEEDAEKQAKYAVMLAMVDFKEEYPSIDEACFFKLFEKYLSE